MNTRLLNLYMQAVQPDEAVKNYRLKWFDKSVAVMFAVSLGALLLKYAGEALAESLLR